MTGRRPDRRLVPVYLATGGRPLARGPDLDRLAVLTAMAPPAPALGPAPRRIMVLLQGGSLSLMEVASHVRLPLAVTRALVSDLVRAGQVFAAAPVPAAQKHDPDLLRRVLSGLEAIR